MPPASCIRNGIDRVFPELAENYDEQKSKDIRKKFDNILHVLQELDIDYTKFQIEGVSHLYAIWYIALLIVNRKLEVKTIRERLILFYTDLRSDKKIKQVIDYQQSMQSASRYKSSIKKRVKALKDFLKI